MLCNAIENSILKSILTRNRILWTSGEPLFHINMLHNI